MESEINKSHNLLDEYIQQVMAKYCVIKYFEKTHSQDSNRLNLCDDNIEKRALLEEQLKIIKYDIANLGSSELIDLYIKSERKNDTNYWIMIFCQDFLSKYETLTPLTRAIEYYPPGENYDDKDFINIFWPVHPTLAPRSCILFSKLLEKEAELNTTLEENIKNSYIDFNFLIPFIEYNKNVEIYFQYCDTLLHLERLTRFKNILKTEYPNSIVQNNENTNVNQELSIKKHHQTIKYENKVSFYTEIARLILSRPESKDKIWSISSFSSEIAEEIYKRDKTDINSSTISNYFFRGDNNGLIKFKKDNPSIFK